MSWDLSNAKVHLKWTKWGLARNKYAASEDWVEHDFFSESMSRCYTKTLGLKCSENIYKKAAKKNNQPPGSFRYSSTV